MMARKLLLFALLSTMLAGCSTIFPLLNEGEVTPTSVSRLQLNCTQGLCVTQTYAFVDGERLNVMFDIVNQQGVVDLSNAPQLVGNLIVGAYYDNDGEEELVFGAEFTQDDYFCYAGEDIPWKLGAPAAVCGFSVTLAEMENHQPQVGDRLRITLPLIQDYSQEVEVQSAEEFLQ
jgi:hypothetical protein